MSKSGKIRIIAIGHTNNRSNFIPKFWKTYFTNFKIGNKLKCCFHRDCAAAQYALFVLFSDAGAALTLANVLFLKFIAMPSYFL